jgi:2,3,4,5-tetrahydropyridine-2-carboxylate N-succinyltransferase
VPKAARGAGLATIDSRGEVLDCWFPAPVLLDAAGDDEVALLSAEDARRHLGADIAALTGEDCIRGVRRVAVEVTVSDLYRPIASPHDLFLRLHLLSHRLAAPRTISVDGLLEAIDHDVAWTSLGPCRASDLGKITVRAQAAGRSFHVRSVFGVPYMLDYVCPSGVMVVDASRVMLGAHLAHGTMVTQKGFCGVNAGTLGPSVVGGHISNGTVIGGGSHLGGGSSLMGMVSGGGREVVTLGERCLLGANAGVGIALGDDCLVEAGCYITAGARVRLADGEVVKARELAGRSRLIFRRNSQNGALEAIENTGRWTGLNPLLQRD